MRSRRVSGGGCRLIPRLGECRPCLGRWCVVALGLLTVGTVDDGERGELRRRACRVRLRSTLFWSILALLVRAMITRVRLEFLVVWRRTISVRLTGDFTFVFICSSTTSHVSYLPFGLCISTPEVGYGAKFLPSLSFLCLGHGVLGLDLFQLTHHEPRRTVHVISLSNVFQAKGNTKPCKTVERCDMLSLCKKRLRTWALSSR